jgi:uncharacterized protein (DUF58 family)
MEFKDAAVALAGIAVVLLALGIFTDGVAFYAACGLALAILAIDLARYLWRVQDLRRNLSVARSISGMELLLGSTVTVSYDLEYLGRRKVPVKCVQPADRSLAIDDSSFSIDLTPGSQTIAFTVRPISRGSHAVKSLRMTVESLLFRGTLTAGGEDSINVYLVTGQDRSSTGSRWGRLQRLQLPGSEALRLGAGSDFSYVRDFTPGDSTRNIDWARSSRSPTLVVRDFEDEHTLPLFILIDVDPSMDRGTTKTELESAVDLANLLASRVLLDNERVGLAFFSRSDITSYQSPAGGKDQMSYIRTALSSLKTVEGDNPSRSGFPTLQEAEAVRQMFGSTAAEPVIAPVLDETMRQFSANVREDGFVKAMARASLSTGTPCSIVVITNLSMGVASLLSGSRIATYYGHNVAVALTPRIWYDRAESDDPEKCFDRYRQAKEMISRLRGRKITVVELSACEKPETVLYQGRARGSTGMIRQRR